METLQLTLLLVLPALIIFAALKDLTSMTIPNWISLALLALFLPAALAVGLPPLSIAIHLGVGLLALAVGIGLFALKVIGGGDAKLMAAACLWLGPSGAQPFVLWTAVMGGVLCLMLMTARLKFHNVAAGGPQWLDRLMQPKGDVPYGLAIAAGALMAYASSNLMQVWTGA